MAKGWMRTTSPTFFSVGCAALSTRVSCKTMIAHVVVFVGTALFSFEGTAPRLLAIRSSFVMRSPAALEFNLVP
jgi:hypothetical protein